MIKRENQQIKYLIQDKIGNINEVEKREFDSKNNISGIIRIHKKDYPFIPVTTPHYTHFNLQRNKHEVGKTYALPKIIKAGSFNENGEEVLPILSFNNCYLGECIYVEQEISYDKLDQIHLQHSLTNINHIEDLKKEMIFCYSKSMPGLTEAEILSLGVSVTKLKINSKFQIPNLEELITAAVKERPGITKEVLQNYVSQNFSSSLLLTMDQNQFNKALDNLELEVQPTPHQNYFHEVQKWGEILKKGYYAREDK